MTVYGKTLIELMPDAALCQKRWPLSDSADFPAVGDYFSALMSIQYPWGVSFLGTGAETVPTTTLGPQLAGKTLPAQIYANTTVLTDNITYQVLDRASSNGGPQSVLSALTYTGKQMAINARNVLELELLHGQEGIGAASGAISTLTVTFDPATISPGILSVLQGARVQWMLANNTTARTANDATNYLTVSTVDFSTDPANPTLTMVATGTTNVAAITTGDLMFIGGSRGTTVAAGDTLVQQFEQIGLGLQLRALTGTQFAIDKANVAWKSNQLNSIGTFSPSILMKLASIVQGRGGELGLYVAILSPAQWGVLNSALATNEVYNQQAPSFAMSKKTGTDDITIKYNGITIECMSHPFQKDGQFYFVCDAQVKRIGSVDLTFAVPGKKGDEEYMYPIQGQGVMQRQCRADWQLINLKPPSGGIGTGVTFS